MDQAALIISGIYKTEHSRLIAILLRGLGSANLDLVEDIVQDSFEQALRSWSSSSVPENPSA